MNGPKKLDLAAIYESMDEARLDRALETLDSIPDAKPDGEERTGDEKISPPPADGPLNGNVGADQF